MKKVGLNRTVKREVIGLIKAGYSVEAICALMKDKSHPITLAPSEVLLVAKQNNLKLGHKKYDKKELQKQQLHNTLNSEEDLAKVKKSLVILVLCLIGLLVAVWLLYGFRAFLIALICIISFIAFIGLFLFIRFKKELVEFKENKKDRGNKNE